MHGEPEIIIHASGGPPVAELKPGGRLLGSEQDLLDLLVEPGAGEVRHFIFHEGSLSPDFFRLSTGLAGAMLQKVSNYHLRAAIVGDFSRYPNASLQAFIRESNRGNQVFFVASVEEALRRLRA